MKLPASSFSTNQASNRAALMKAKLSPAICWAYFWALATLLLSGERGLTQANLGALQPGTARVVEIEGVVEVQRAGATPWDPSRTNQVLYPGDHLRAGLHSRAALLLSDFRTLRLGELGHIQMPEAKRTGLNFFRGILYFFHRDKPGEFEFRSPTVSAVVRGTEFNLQVSEDQTTTLMMFDGEVEMTNQLGQLTLRSGQGGIAKPNQRQE